MTLHGQLPGGGYDEHHGAALLGSALCLHPVLEVSQGRNGECQCLPCNRNGQDQGEIEGGRIEISVLSGSEQNTEHA